MLRTLIAFMLSFAEAFRILAPPTKVYATNQTIMGRGPTIVDVQPVGTATRTITAAENGTTFSTKGATGTVTFTLPAAVVGLRYGFYVGAVQELRVDPAASEVMQLPSTGANQTGGAYLTANAIGERLEIECIEAGVWSVRSSVGTWTAV